MNINRALRLARLGFRMTHDSDQHEVLAIRAGRVDEAFGKLELDVLYRCTVIAADAEAQALHLTHNRERFVLRHHRDQQIYAECRTLDEVSEMVQRKKGWVDWGARMRELEKRVEGEHAIREAQGQSQQEIDPRFAAAVYQDGRDLNQQTPGSEEKETRRDATPSVRWAYDLGSEWRWESYWNGKKTVVVPPTAGVATIQALGDRPREWGIRDCIVCGATVTHDWKCQRAGTREQPAECLSALGVEAVQTQQPVAYRWRWHWPKARTKFSDWKLIFDPSEVDPVARQQGHFQIEALAPVVGVKVCEHCGAIEANREAHGPRCPARGVDVPLAPSSTEAMRLALAALEKSVDNFQANVQHRAAILALRAALAAGVEGRKP